MRAGNGTLEASSGMVEDSMAIVEPVNKSKLNVIMRTMHLEIVDRLRFQFLRNLDSQGHQ